MLSLVTARELASYYLVIMDRNSVDSSVGSSTSFKTAQESFGSVEKADVPNKPSPVSSGHFTPAKEESAFISGSPWEITPRPTHKDIEKPQVVNETEELEPKPKPKPQIPESQKHYSTFVPSQPIPIPGAVPKRRVPTLQEDGTLAMSGSTAPRTEKEIEEMEKEEARDQALAEKYERMKENMFKWHAENQGRFLSGYLANKLRNSQSGDQSSNQAGNQSSNWARKSIDRLRDILSAGRMKDSMDKSDSSDDSVDPQETVQSGETTSLSGEDEIPKYQQAVMQPFAAQYGHTIATMAYEEGLKIGRHKEESKMKKSKPNTFKPKKSTAFKKGYMAGLAQARKEKEYKLGCKSPTPISPLVQTIVP